MEKTHIQHFQPSEFKLRLENGIKSSMTVIRIPSYLLSDASTVANLTLVGGALVVITVIKIVISSHLRLRHRKKPKVDVPILGLDANYAEATNRYMQNLKDILDEGYRKFRDGVYQIWGIDGFLVIVSPKHVEELNAIGTDALDLHAASQTRIIGDYEWQTIASQLLFHSVQVDLTRQIGNLIPGIDEEIEYARELYFPTSNHWTPFKVWPCMLKTMTLLVSRMTVGPELSRNEEWLATMTGWLHDLFAGGWELKTWSLAMRPIVARGLVPGIRRVWQHQAKAKAMLVPIIRRRRAAGAEAQVRGLQWERPNDLLQYMSENAAKLQPRKSDAFVAEMCLVVGFGALHATSMTLTNAIFDLATMPRYQDVIREEYLTKRMDSMVNGKESSLINSMSKLDSFIKESQRLNPINLSKSALDIFTLPGGLRSQASFSRQVVKPITLSSGLHLPSGTHILTPTCMVSLDPKIYESPSEFKGLRFHERREGASGSATYRNQLTSTSTEQMHFGFGRQACPGRFFGGTSIKCVILQLIQEFDLKLVDEKLGRPKNTIKGAMSFPSETAEVLIRHRKI
ncbi:MAG: hypothetical protein M1820_001858 [Bogoriella megaspora]|nr:MAG: hypothetical protein M1820_001858 [Bogoriella megaspora]